MFKNGMRAVHPGEILREDYLIPLGITATALAKFLNVPAPRINEIVRERRAVTADTAMRLTRYFGGDARSWLNLQTEYDLRIAEIRNAKRIKREVASCGSIIPVVYLPGALWKEERPRFKRRP
ncbi:MAG: HigA family addiction module antitoxin [Pyrinomonadaceae bacterium]